MQCSGAHPGDKGTDKGGKGGKDCNTGKGQSGKTPAGNITGTATGTLQQGSHDSTGQPSDDSTLGWQQYWDNAPPWQHVQQSDHWQAQPHDPHDDSWGDTWPAPMDGSAVPTDPGTIPAGHSPATAADTALAAAESAHNSEQAACAHAASAEKAADEAADHLSETQTVLGEIKFVVKQFGKCNMCKKWCFVHKDLCIYPGCSRNPLTSQVDSMGQQLKTLHDQVTAQDALINTLLHSSGTSSSSTSSPDVLQAQAQHISALTSVILQMVQHSAVPQCPPSMPTLTVWQGQQLSTMLHPRPKYPSSVPHTASTTRMPAQSSATPPPVMAARCKPMPALPLHMRGNITMSSSTPPAHTAIATPPVQVPPAQAPHAEVFHDVHIAGPPAQLHHNQDGAAELHADQALDGDDADDEDELDDDDDDDDDAGSAECGSGSRPAKKKKRPVGRKFVPKKKRHPTDM
jgi:hypothetical protein